MTNITTLHPGEHFMFKDYEWVCLDPNHPDGGVLAIMEKPWQKDIKFCPDEQYADEKGNWNNYRNSIVRENLLLNMGPAIGRENILMHEVDLVADNGDRSYGTVNDKVFLITCDEYRKYRDYIPHYDSWIWTATPLYCGDNASDAGGAYFVRSVSTGGKLSSHNVCSSNAVVPACILNPKSLNLRQSMAYVEEAKNEHRSK
nr:MAG TPA: hypothetical protein [Caudoviricetes sp.]